MRGHTRGRGMRASRGRSMLGVRVGWLACAGYCRWGLLPYGPMAAVMLGLSKWNGPWSWVMGPTKIHKIKYDEIK